MKKITVEISDETHADLLKIKLALAIRAQGNSLGAAIDELAAIWKAETGGHVHLSGKEIPRVILDSASLGKPKTKL